MWLFVSVYVSSSTSKLSIRLCTFLIHKAERHVETSGFHIIRSQLPVLELRSMFKLRVLAFRLSSVFAANSVLIGLFISRCISSEKNNPEILQFLFLGTEACSQPPITHFSGGFLGGANTSPNGCTLVTENTEGNIPFKLLLLRNVQNQRSLSHELPESESMKITTDAETMERNKSQY